MNRTAIENLRVDLSALVDEGRIPGAAVVVEQDGKILIDIRVGYRDVESGEALPSDAIFRLYSMSKPVTSVAIMMLAEQGLLSLDDPASRFLPEFSDLRVYASGGLDDMRTEPAARPITVADLLSHASGITSHFAGDAPVHQYYRRHGVMRDTPVGRLAGDGAPARDLDELVARIGRAPLLHQPGQQFDYSYSTTMLGAVVERATGRRLDEALQAMIFDPLDMAAAGFFIADADLDRLVTNYVALPGGLMPIETPEASEYRDRGRLQDGGGALLATAGDYMNFCRMLIGGGGFRGRRLLSEAAVREMMVPRVMAEIAPIAIPFGYGFALGTATTAAAGLQPAGTASWGGSAGTYFFVEPSTRAIALLMTHVLALPPSDLSVVLRKRVNAAAMEVIDR